MACQGINHLQRFQEVGEWSAVIERHRRSLNVAAGRQASVTADWVEQAELENIAENCSPPWRAIARGLLAARAELGREKA